MHVHGIDGWFFLRMAGYSFWYVIGTVVFVPAIRRWKERRRRNGQ